jgi:hypothetical protein
MADKTWFYAPGDEQMGPCSERELQNLIANGTIRADTPVWSEGMADWQAARDAGLFPRVGGMPPRLSQGSNAAALGGGERLSLDFGILEFLGRALLFLIGFLLVIPAPWAATSFYRWIIQRVHVPGHPNLSFTGRPMDIWWVLMLLALCTWSGAVDTSYLPLLLIPVQAFLGWMVIRWVIANLASNGQPLNLSFTGDALRYIGWYLLIYLSFITIIGWAWVMAYWTRWMCRHIAGTRRPVFFNGTGLQILWRTLVLTLASVLIIPIPWMIRWYGRWYVSQISLGAPDRT